MRTRVLMADYSLVPPRILADIGSVGARTASVFKSPSINGRWRVFELARYEPNDPNGDLRAWAILAELGDCCRLEVGMILEVVE